MNETKKRYPILGAVVVIGGMVGIFYGFIQLLF
ncbi:hypothetical protein OKW24_005702 [Peribacillus simplex]|nr:hypothetical protein [Peribacillus simplex]